MAKRGGRRGQRCGGVERQGYERGGWAFGKSVKPVKLAWSMDGEKESEGLTELVEVGLCELCWS